MTEPLDPAAPRPEQGLHPGSRALLADWNRLRGARAAPQRSELSLRPLAAVLPYMFILERHSLLPRFLFRLAGTELRRLRCRELTGTDFLAPWNAADRGAIAALLGAVVGAQRPCLFRGTGSAVGKRALGFEVIALPIRLDHRDAIHVLGAIHTFACPLWLGEVPMQHFHLDDLLSLEAAAATGPARSLAAPPRGARLRLIPGGAAPHGRD